MLFFFLSHEFDVTLISQRVGLSLSEIWHASLKIGSMALDMRKMTLITVGSEMKFCSVHLEVRLQVAGGG